jgi:hypothetical protein
LLPLFTCVSLGAWFDGTKITYLRLGIGNEWFFKNGITIGVDWVAVNIPLWNNIEKGGGSLDGNMPLAAIFLMSLGSALNINVGFAF